MEMIHSRSYTYIIKNVYSDPSEVFDKIVTDDRILERASSVTAAYDDFSFACSFAFGELKLMEGSAKIISLIARDENQHLAITQNILNKWKQGDDPEMKQIMKEEEEWTYKAFDNAVNEEKRWADYLFKDGSMIGLNDKLLQQYVEWIANRRLVAIGLKRQYDVPAKNNPLPWTQHWISSKGLQVAPQETEVESYVVGGIKQDVKKDTFSGFQL